jgi:hypothetical protein
VKWKCGNGTHDRQVSWKSEGKSQDLILLVYLAKIPHLHNSKHPHGVSIVENIPIILFPSQTHPCTLQIKNLQKLYIAKHKSKVVFPLKLNYFMEPCYMNEDTIKNTIKFFSHAKAIVTQLHIFATNLCHSKVPYQYEFYDNVDVLELFCDLDNNILDQKLFNIL